MKLAILFSGQGSQFTDMGLDFYQESPIFKDCVDKASEIADFKITSVFANNGDKLSETKYIQQLTYHLEYSVTFSRYLYS